MGANTQNSNDSQEIDLSYLSKKTANFFDNLGYSFYKFFRFLLKNIIILSVLVVIGVLAGYFLDRQFTETYKQEILVVPNFNSNSYLYNKVENIDLKDSKIKSIKVEPVLDVYQFIKDEWGNLEVAKYLSENNIEFTKYQPNSDVEKMYRYHLMTIETKGLDKGGKTVDSLLNEFNKDPYYLERQKIEIENTKNLIADLEKSIINIEQILQKIGTVNTSTGELNIEMYAELNNLINSKKSAVIEINKYKIHQFEQSKIICPTSKMLNVKEKKVPKIILLPILLIGLFLIASLFIEFFKKYNRIEKSNPKT